MAGNPPGRLVQLATAILQHAMSIETDLASNGQPDISLEPGASSNVPPSPTTAASLDEALAAVDELIVLLLGPLGWLKTQMGHVYDLVSLHAMYRYNIPAQFPVGEEISFGEVARRCGVDHDPMARLLQHAAANYMLIESRPGYVKHSVCSAMLAQSPALMDWVGSACEDMWPAAPQAITALCKWPTSAAQPHQTGHNIAEGTDVPFFQTLAAQPTRLSRFAGAMTMMQQIPGYEPSAALDLYDWGTVGNGTVVDVGGSSGGFATLLARKYPTIEVVVQDLPAVIAEASPNIPPDLAGRIALQDHDFFTPQPVHGADAYFLRMILHDWPDQSCVQILQQLIPALKPGARVILNETCMPSSSSMSRYHERQIRCQDLAMMATFNSKERSQAQWVKLITEADPRFRIGNVIQRAPSTLGLLEIIWTP